VADGIMLPPLIDTGEAETIILTGMTLGSNYKKCGLLAGIAAPSSRMQKDNCEGLKMATKTLSIRVDKNDYKFLLPHREGREGEYFEKDQGTC
jgi:hypothetical protein